MDIQPIKNYLTLIRFPNLSTIPSNIMAGYFAVNIENNFELGTVVLLIFCSSCLYASGVIFNDIADRQIDRKERPSRPIPAGKITIPNAISLALLLVGISIAISYFISEITLAIVVALISVILLYDFVLKNYLIGSAVMGTTRALNILLGGSPLLFNVIVDPSGYSLYRLLAVFFSEFAYITGISTLSRFETHKDPSFRVRSTPTLFFLSPLVIGVYSVSIGLFNNSAWIFLVIFSCFMLFVIKFGLAQKQMTDLNMQRIIGLLIAGIILHDAVYIGGSMEWYFGAATYSWLIPLIMLNKRYYVT